MSNRFNHFLNFKSLPSVGRIQVSEPMGFDASSYKVKRDTKRFGRDVHIANEKQELIFTRENFEELVSPQFLPNGDLFKHAGQGFYFIKDIYENEGGEGEIEYIIQDAKTETDFVTGIFDMYTINLDYNEITVSIIQNTNRETFKRLEDTDIDAFNTKDLDGNTITPCPVHNVLIKAKPIFQKSSWKSQPDNVASFAAILDTGSGVEDLYVSANNANVSIDYAIEDSLSFLDPTVGTNIPGVLNDEAFTYLYAQNNLNNVNIKITNIIATAQSTTNAHVLTASGYARLVVKTGVDVDNIDQEYVLYNRDFTNSNSGAINLPTELSLNIPFLQRGTRLYIYAYCDANATFDGGGILPSYSTILAIDNLDISIDAVSTSLDTISKGVRIIDLYKHAVRSINPDMIVVAPEYEVGGTHYDNFCFNGLLLGNITTKPFKNKFKDLNNIFRETCSDYQISGNTIEIRPYKGYYNDVKMASFEQIPSNEAVTMFNPIYCLKNAEFKYDKSSSDRETNSENTIDDVHTETQKLFPTRKADNILKEEIKHIRSNFLIENARKRALDNDQNTTLENDDDLIIIKCLLMPTGKLGVFNGVLSMRITSGNVLQLLNNNRNGDGINFNWGSLGLLLGTQVTITFGENVGTYLVSTVILDGEPVSVLDLTYQTGSPIPTFQGDAFISMQWTYSNVAYMNQTNEGYSLVEGVANADDFGNLDYTWARNIKHWYPYLATASKFLLGKFITTTSFKINGGLRTQKFGETSPLGDSDPVNITEISTLKVLNPHNHKIKVYCDFVTMKQLVADIAAVKGYVEVRLNDKTTVTGFPYELDYVWLTEELTLSIEEKYISDFVDITNTIVSGVNTIFVDEVGKEQKSGVVSYIIDDIFVILYNDRGVALNTPTRFTKFKINGTNYTDVLLFCEALDNLIEL